MINRFYNNSLEPALGSLIQGAAIEGQLDGITAGMLLIQEELDRIAGIGGITTLSGFPASFAGGALKYLRVNAAESAIEFVALGGLTIKSIGGTSYTLLASDAGSLLIFTNASPVTLTVNAATLPVGQATLIRQGAAGRVTIVAGTGSPIFQSSDSLLATRTQGAQIGIISDDGAAQYGVFGERNAPSLSFATLTGGNDFSGAQTVNFATLVDDSFILTDAAVSNHFNITMVGNRSLANPTNLRDGGIYNYWIKQDATGSRTLTYGSLFKWPGGTAPVLSTAAGALDLLIVQYNATRNILGGGSLTKDVR